MRTLLILATLGLAACGDKDDDTGEAATTDGATDGGTATDANASCTPVEWTDGSTGTFTVMAGESDIKHHWNMPEGTVRLVGEVTWDATDWDMELSLGTGTCPDSGEELCANAELGGTATVELLAADLGEESFEAEVRWFAHLSMMSGGELDDSTGYAIEVLACTE